MSRRNIATGGALALAVLLLTIEGTACREAELIPRWEEWSAGLPRMSLVPERRGLQVARGIIHLHSPFSHDACDGNGLIDGEINQPCLDSLRRAVCVTRQDFALLTDHPAHMEEFPFEQLLHLRDGDVPIRDASDRIIGARWDCGDGFSTLVMAGYEGRLMPVGLHEHASEELEERKEVYRGADAAAADRLRGHGGFVLVPHPEQWSVDELVALSPDGVEAYNLHANLDPRIREQWLGLPGLTAAAGVVPFWIEPEETPIPDLAALAFLEQSRVWIDKWQALTLLKPTTAIGGSDAHENVFGMELADGERGDSYRRVMRWFSNHLLVTEVSPEGIREALEAGRNYIAFEVLGSPDRFDFFAENAAGEHGIGSDLAADGVTLVVRPPLFLEGEVDQAPDATIRLVRVTGSPEKVTEEIVAERKGPLTKDPLSIAAPGPGVYHVEITLVPHHLRRWMGPNPDEYLREFPWIFSGAIYLR